MLKFDLQLFGGKGGTSIQTTEYTPTEFELQLQKIQVDYTEAIMPNALWLNARARDVLEGSIGESGDYTETFTKHFETANVRVDSAFNELDSEIRRLKFFADDLNYSTDKIITEAENWNENVTPITEILKNLIGKYGGDFSSVNADLKSEQIDASFLLRKLIRDYQSFNNETTEKLNEILPEYDSVTSSNVDVENTIAENIGRKISENAPNLNNVINVLSRIVGVNDSLKAIDNNLVTVTAQNISDLDTLPAQFDSIAENVNSSLTVYVGDISSVRGVNYGDLDTLPTEFNSIAENVNSKLIVHNDDKKTRDINYSDLDELAPKFSGEANKINLGLDGIDDSINNKLSSHYDNYDQIIPHFVPNAMATNAVLSNLETGSVPADWQTNMHNAIKLSIENTVGKVINAHASRGVINSSVTTQAIYDIERNTADEVNRQYQQNISQIAQMSEMRWKNIEDALNDMKNSYDNLMGEYLNGAGQKAQIKQFQFNNINTALMDELQTYNSQFGNYLQATNQAANFDNSRFANKTNSLQNELQTFNQQFNNSLQSANAREKIYQDEFNNETTAAMNRANLYNAIFSNALNAYQQQANIQGEIFNSQMANLNAQNQLYNQILSNTFNAYDHAAKTILDNYKIVGDGSSYQWNMYNNWIERLLQVYEADYQKKINSIDYARQIFEERTRLAQIANEVYDRIFAHAGKPMALLAAAQEAAQQPALRLWNASIGLNQSATGSLVALSNQGTRTTTTEQNGGSFLGGLFGGLTSAFAGGLASGYGGTLGNALFK